jgi:release factor glutamine methyltransferase
VKARETLEGVIIELERAGVESARAEAEILIAAALGLLEEPRAAVYAAGARELESAQARTLASLVMRRLDGEPVQYVVRRAWFRDLVLEVGPGVLIPRPETERLVEEVLRWLGERDAARILDLGTGSGCIVLALAHEHPGVRALGVDVSPAALGYAARNRERLGALDPTAAERVSFWASDLFAALSPEARFEVIVSNPPYVGREETERLPREVREHEPEAALFAPGHATAILEAIVDRAPGFLAPRGLLALEIGETHADNVTSRIDAARAAGLPAYETPRVLEDLTGRPRLVLAERRPDPRPAQGRACPPPPR